MPRGEDAMVSPRTAKKWADRYRAEDPAGMADRKTNHEVHHISLVPAVSSTLAAPVPAKQTTGRPAAVASPTMLLAPSRAEG